MNLQSIFPLEKGIKSNEILTFLSIYLCISLFLPAGFISTGFVLILIYSLLARDKSFLRSIQKQYILLLPITLFIVYSIGLIGSSDIEEGTTRAMRRVSLALLPLSIILINKKISKAEIDVISLSFIISFILCMLYCYSHALANVINHQSFIIPGLERPYYYFTYIPLVEPAGFMPIYLSFYGNFALLMTLENGLLTNKYLKGVIAFFIFCSILLIAAKVGIIAVFVLLIIYGFFKLKGTSFILFLIFFLGLTISIFSIRFVRERFILPTEYDYTWPDPHQWNSFTLRLAIWNCSLTAMERNILWGYGTGDGQKALEEVYTEVGFTRALAESYNSHNEFFTTTLDIGLFGLLILVTIIAASIYRSYSNKNYIQLNFIILSLIFFLVESMLLRQKGVVFFSLFYSILFSEPSISQSKSSGDTDIQ